MQNLVAIDVGKGVHFIQEDNPHLIGEEIAKWLTSRDNQDNELI